MPKRPDSTSEELRRVYRAHVRAVYAFLAYSVSREVAEDLTSTTFERVVRSWDKFDPARASERTWVMAIARNALTDHFRRQRHRTTVSTDEHPVLLEQLASAEDPLARQLTHETLVSWLGSLGDRERQVLAMRFGADMSARDVANALDIAEGNVHQIASRALRRLRAVEAPEKISDSARPSDSLDDPR